MSLQNIKWYNFLVKSEENYEKCLLNFHQPEEKALIIFCDSDNKIRYAKFDTIFEFINFFYFKTNIKFRCFHECIFGYMPQKIYFDIDIPLEIEMSEQDLEFVPKLNSQIIHERCNITPKEKYLTIKEATEAKNILVDCITSLEPYIKSKDIIILKSHGPEKRSYHIIVDNWCFPDALNNQYFYKEIMKIYPEKYKKVVDAGMYTSTKNFRIYGSHKWGSERSMVFDEDSEWTPPIEPINEKHREQLIMFHSLVSNCSYCKILPKYAPEIVKKEFDDKMLEAPEIQEAMDMCAKHFMCENYEDKKFPFVISGIKNSLILLKRRFPSYCKVCKKDHHSQNSFIIASKNGVYLDCRRNPDKKRLCLGYLTKILGKEEEDSGEESDISDLSDISESEFSEIASISKENVEIIKKPLKKLSEDEIKNEMKKLNIPAKKTISREEKKKLGLNLIKKGDIKFKLNNSIKIKIPENKQISNFFKVH